MKTWLHAWKLLSQTASCKNCYHIKHEGKSGIDNLAGWLLATKLDIQLLHIELRWY